MNRPLMMNRPLLRSMLALLTLPAVVLSGCNPFREVGAEASNGTSTFISTTDLPKTVWIKDYRDGSEIWSYELPVGRQLVVQFLKDKFDNLPARPDKMQWGEMAPGEQYGQLKNEMAVPRTTIIGFDLRTPGESAPGVKPKGVRTTTATGE